MIKKKICDYLYLVAGVLFFISGFIYHNSTFYILSVYFVIICIVEKNNDDKNNLDWVYLIRNILYRRVSVEKYRLWEDWDNGYDSLIW